MNNVINDNMAGYTCIKRNTVIILPVIKFSDFLIFNSPLTIEKVFDFKEPQRAFLFQVLSNQY